jgi:hypothetical protein
MDMPDVTTDTTTYETTEWMSMPSSRQAVGLASDRRCGWHYVIAGHGGVAMTACRTELPQIGEDRRLRASGTKHLRFAAAAFRFCPLAHPPVAEQHYIIPIFWG